MFVTWFIHEHLTPSSIFQLLLLNSPSHADGCSWSLKSAWFMHLLTSFTIATNAMCEAMASRVKFWVLCLLFFFHLLDNLTLLLLREFFAIYSSVLSGYWGQTFSVFFFLYRPPLRRCLLLHLRWLNIIFGCSKVKLNVCLDTANLVIGPALHDVYCIVTASILDVNCVPFKEHRVMSQLLLKDGLRVG